MLYRLTQESMSAMQAVSDVGMPVGQCFLYLGKLFGEETIQFHHFSAPIASPTLARVRVISNGSSRASRDIRSIKRKTDHLPATSSETGSRSSLRSSLRSSSLSKQAVAAGRTPTMGLAVSSKVLAVPTVRSAVHLTLSASLFRLQVPFPLRVQHEASRRDFRSLLWQGD